MAVLTVRRETPVLTDFFNTDGFYKALKTGYNNILTVPATNISESDTEFKVTIAAPGFDKDDFIIGLDNNGVLEISAENEAEEESEEDNFTRQEYDYSSFSRSFTLPDSVDSREIEATYENGILSLFLPKKSEAKENARQEIKIS